MAENSTTTATTVPPGGDENASGRGNWGSRLGFILAAAGSAVGLGNIWKFPYITGENGGGAFVLIYLVCVAVVGLPIMIAEVMIGRGTQKSPVGAFTKISGPDSGWRGVGWLGIVAGFIILSYYSVVAGWTLNYTLMSFCDVYHVDKVVPFAGTAEPQETLRIFPSSSSRSAVLYKTGPDGVQRILKAGKDFKVITDPEGTWADFVLAKPLDEGNTVEVKYRTPKDKKSLESAFGTLYTSLGINILWHTVFMLMCVGIVCKGISRGIEEWSKTLMPLLFILILILLVNSIFSGGFGRGVRFLFGFDMAKLKPSGVLEALGHAFFTLSLGMGAMLTYGSYLRRDSDVVSSSIQVSILDTVVAMMACLVIFPIVFAHGFPPQGGPGLVFKTMPIIFSQMQGGTLFAILFFLLLAFAALTSAISLLEVVASYFIDEMGMCRVKATVVTGILIYILGIFSAVAGTGMIFPEWESLFGKNFFDTLDFFATNWMLPMGGLLIAVYVGWFVPGEWREQEFKEGSSFGYLYGFWLFSIRFIAPIAISMVFLQKIGFIDIDRILG